MTILSVIYYEIIYKLNIFNIWNNSSLLKNNGKRMHHNSKSKANSLCTWGCNLNEKLLINTLTQIIGLPLYAKTYY